VRHKDSFNQPKQGFKLGASMRYDDKILGAHGRFLIELRDSQTGDLLHYEERDNVVTRDGGVFAAMGFASGSAGSSGLTMLAVGTGATGSLLNPDAPDPRQRHLNAEIARKAFSSTTFRTSEGAVSAVPTNIVDFTTVFGEGEAVGPLTEMGLIRAFSANPLVTTPVPSTFPTYDPTIDLTQYDVQVNLLNFPVVSKPSMAILTITWRLTF